MACSSTCPTQDHESFGACLRSKGVGAIGYRESLGRTSEASRTTQTELDLYASAVRQGIQPASTKLQAVQDALIISDQVEAGYGVDFAQATPLGDPCGS